MTVTLYPMLGRKNLSKERAGRKGGTLAELAHYVTHTRYSQTVGPTDNQ